MSDKNKEYKNLPERRLIQVKMTLLSDTIFGNGMCIPGEEDISVLTDAHGFPYYKGSTFKGLFREEMGRLIKWKSSKTLPRVELLFGEGKSGVDDIGDLDMRLKTEARRLSFSDFVLSPHVRKVICDELGDNTGMILDCLSNIRAFTRISDEGTADKGSLRYARCINQGLVFYSTISCSAEDEDLVKEALSFVKWIGTLRNRGFGHVRLEEDKKEGTADRTAEKTDNAARGGEAE